jgi:hypothetical protein
LHVPCDEPTTNNPDGNGAQDFQPNGSQHGCGLRHGTKRLAERELEARLSPINSLTFVLAMLACPQSCRTFSIPAVFIVCIARL